MFDERPLYKSELDLIQALLDASCDEPKPKIEASARVTQMDDGGMGSIQFVYSDPNALKKAVSEAQYTDSDGVLVSITLNIDKNGRLLEPDFWKVDFSPLKRYPQPGDLVLKI